MEVTWHVYLRSVMRLTGMKHLIELKREKTRLKGTVFNQVLAIELVKELNRGISPARFAAGPISVTDWASFKVSKLRTCAMHAQPRSTQRSGRALSAASIRDRIMPSFIASRVCHLSRLSASATCRWHHKLTLRSLA